MASTLLLIQEDPQDARAVRNALTCGDDGSLRIEWVRRLSEGLERLAIEGNHADRMPSISAVLLDLSLPDSSGIATFDVLFEAAPHIPVLILCGLHDEEIAKLAVQRGAQDYLLKARLDSYSLPKAIRSMVERASNADALFEANERAQVTLNSIGDAVICTDVWGGITYLNTVAERLTGWSRTEATGRPLEEVFRIVNAETRKPADNPMALAVRENKTVALTPNCLLLRRDGVETAIEDSAAPIHDRRGHVTGAVMVFHDVTASRALSLRMSYLAQHDSLTDLPNRILLDDRLTEAIELAGRYQRKLAVLFLDIDRFKHINDSLGHAIGDRLLQSIGERLALCTRASDTVSRNGGDEFVILLLEITDAQDAAVSAQKILAALRAPHLINGHNLHVTVSIGIVTYPHDGTDVQTLLKHADFAMYHAKETGRDNYQFFKSEMNLRAIERQSVENGLRHAVERQELVLHYQPKVNLDTGVITGVEALVRWNHPTRGLVSPGEFIPVAEECGFIASIGRWVLREACRQAHGWQLLGFPRMRLAVNVSTVELRAKDFVASLLSVLEQTGFGPDDLELELTETVLMQDSHIAAGVLQSLSDLGVHLALDDFGTGYSSLSYLKRFPIDTLKIDRSFVRDMTTDPDDASIVNAVISMGKSLHLRVVAEGIETSEQFALLQGQDCPVGQGFLFSPPVPASDFESLLAAGNHLGQFELSKFVSDPDIPAARPTFRCVR